uniref:Uncharacterized protein n=1 Tax=Anguilla anguilla TaxID=7936 RepID=A0A0E9PTH6_ANGAN
MLQSELKAFTRNSLQAISDTLSNIFCSIKL